MNDLDRTATLTLLDAEQGSWQLDWYYRAGGYDAPRISPNGLAAIGAQEWADGVLDALALSHDGSIWVANRDETLWTAYFDLKPRP